MLYMDSAKASYQYQRSISAEPSGHRNGVALLSKWYGMLHEKRSWRHDFLKALCRAFDGDLEDQMVSRSGSFSPAEDQLTAIQGHRSGFISCRKPGDFRL